jgi:hypothetical protein
MNGYMLNRIKTGNRKERGVVLIAVLLFIGMILPVTLLILDTVRIESLLPVNEAYSKTAGYEAEKGFHEALAAILKDQDSLSIDFSRDYIDGSNNFNFAEIFKSLDPDSPSGKHEVDYLAESWARHPDNDTIYLVERSLENYPSPDNPDAGADPDEHKVPTRFQLMNVPFGMDDFGEFFDDGGDSPHILLPFSYEGETNDFDLKNAPAYYVDPTEYSMLQIMSGGNQPEGSPASEYPYDNLVNGRMWQASPASPFYYENVNRLDPVYTYMPRPASYFRNAKSAEWEGIGSAGLPFDEGSTPSGFLRDGNNDVDLLVYDSLYDHNNVNATNQYPYYLPLQQAVTDSTWANQFFGSTGQSAGLSVGVNLFASSNLEYKPAPGSISAYQLGAEEENVTPGWHETIVSDESGRFPINSLLNIVYASENLEYDDDNVPILHRDQFDGSPQNSGYFPNPVTAVNSQIDPDHPNAGGYLMARDMLVSLLIPDGVMAKLASNWDSGVYDQYENKAERMLNQMLEKRAYLDQESDFTRDGRVNDDDRTVGEIFQYPELTGNNNSNTLDIAPPNLNIIDGSGKMGDGADQFDGTWQVYSNPREMLTEFYDPGGPAWRLTDQDFQLLNDRVTVYTMDTEHAADPDHRPIAATWPDADVRYNINHMLEEDDLTTASDESALFKYLMPVIGLQRLRSIIAWRDGLVDLNGDGDLGDEFIEQPVSDVRYDPTGPGYVAADDYPVSTFTYRERGNPNFQNPILSPALIDPDYLNIRNLGDLLTIPMSIGEPLVAYSQAPNQNTDFELRITDESNNIQSTVNDGTYPDFSNSGTEIAYNQNGDIVVDNLDLDAGQTIVNNADHPSWGPNDESIVYFDDPDLVIIDRGTGTQTTVPMNNVDIPSTQNDSAAIPFFGSFGDDAILGVEEFQLSSPDYNSTADQIAFSRVFPSAPDDDFLDRGLGSGYGIARVNGDGSGLQLLTQLPVTYDYAPDYSSDGDFILFTRSTYLFWNLLVNQIPGNDLDDYALPIPSTSLWIMNSNGTGQFPVINPGDITFGPGGNGLINIDFINANRIEITMHNPMFGNFSPDDSDIIFMDVELHFEVDRTAPAPQEVTMLDDPITHVYRIDVGALQDWQDANEFDTTVADSTLQVFPDWGGGARIVAQQGDKHFGSILPTPLTLTLSPGIDQPTSASDRATIASEIKFASLAFRQTIGSGADDQNWRLMDLPTVPEHVASALRQSADVICFADPLVKYDPDFQVDPPPLGAIPEPPLQAFPGRININTATRPVLRTVFMNMFQGPEEDVDSANGANSPAPRVDVGGTARPVNLMDPGTTQEERFNALLLADRYANQVCEYRTWIYNNQGPAGITDETVPSNLPIYRQEYINAGVFSTFYGNYRANPLYPLIDTDGDGNSPDTGRYNPEPPFRSVADLFNISLYDNRPFDEDWTYEGIDGPGGPDPNYIPEIIDNNTGNDVGSYDTYDFWGPIFNTDQQRILTHGNQIPGNSTLYGYPSRVMNNPAAGNYNNFIECQQFRLLSADDFKRIAPWLTVRTYNYRIESRGVIRVASGIEKTDITRDKMWIITLNTEANYGRRYRDDADMLVPMDESIQAQNPGVGEYYIQFYEETSQAGLELTRSNFLP